MWRLVKNVLRRRYENDYFLAKWVDKRKSVGLFMEQK